MKCDNCGSDREMALPMVNSRGIQFAMVCQQCHPIVQRDVVHRIDRLHGAHIVDGAYQCSPVGTPPYRSLQQARNYLQSRLGNSEHIQD